MPTVHYLVRDLEDGSGWLDFFNTRDAAMEAIQASMYQRGVFSNEQVRQMEVADPSGISFDYDLPDMGAPAGCTPILFLLRNVQDGSVEVEFFRGKDAWSRASLEATEGGVINESCQVFHVKDPTGIAFSDNNYPEPKSWRNRR